jgi:hypothetical protein
VGGSLSLLDVEQRDYENRSKYSANVIPYAFIDVSRSSQETQHEEEPHSQPEPNHKFFHYWFFRKY